jgi:hypothetical protein
VNQTGLEAGLPEMPGELPVLQDTAAVDAWSKWGAAWRDVVIVDRKGHKTAVYNLSEHDLSDAANRDALKALLVEAAAP